MTGTLFFQIALRNMSIIFAAILCFLPMRGRFELTAWRIFKTGVVLLIWLLISTLLIMKTGVFVNITLLPALPVFFFLYCRLIDTAWYQSLAIFCISVALFHYTELYTFIFSARTFSGQVFTDYTWKSSIFAFLLSLACLLIFWIPASVHARWMIEHFHNKTIWINIIAWTIFFTLIANFIIPLDFRTLHRNRFFEIYLLLVTLIFFCMLYMYYLLYQNAKSSDNLLTLEKHNQFLSFQSRQYHLLVRHMEDTRRLRHDFRQQLRVIQNLVNQKDLDSLKKYLSDNQDYISPEYHPVCTNPAANAIFAYYDSYCREQNIRISWAVNLPKKLPLPEPEFCIMAGNLLENAVDACRSLPKGKGSIHFLSHMATDSMLILMIENTYSTPVRIKRGRFLSSKHSGDAVGLSSVQETVAQYQGDMRIDYDEHTFQVNILLNL